MAIWRVQIYLYRLDLGVGTLPLTLGLACIVVILSTIFAMTVASVSSKWFTHFNLKRYIHLGPAVRTKLASHLTGMDETAELASLRLKDRRVVDRCVLEVLSSITGVQKERMARLAVSLGIVDRWLAMVSSRDAAKRRRAASALRLLGIPEFNVTLRACLDDEDESISFEAARALLQTDDAQAVNAVFQFAMEGSLLRRAVLAMDLKRFAASLCVQEIPDALRSSNPERILAALQIIRAWQIALPIDAIVPITNHPSAAIRTAALDAVPWQIGSIELAREWTPRLNDSVPGPQAAAARAIKTMRIESAVFSLRTVLVESTDRELLYAVASALAVIGAKGESVLHSISLESSTIGAHAALSALERIHIGSTIDRGSL